jgi:two-component system cell cycle sensor histidine kinase PleC
MCHAKTEVRSWFPAAIRRRLTRPLPFQDKAFPRTVVLASAQPRDSLTVEHGFARGAVESRSVTLSRGAAPQDHIGTQRMAGEHNVLPRTLSLAAHEFATPLSVATGYLRMLLKDQFGPLSERQRKLLDEIQRSCSRIAELVSEMSLLGKLESRELALVKQEFDCATLVAEVASGMHEGGDRGVRIEVRGTDRALSTVGDRVRLAAALRSLMHAAVRERAGPGVVIVECSANAGIHPPSLTIAIGDDATVRVLAESDAPRMPVAFEEFRGGLGLALPIARRVVEAHGGAVWSAENPKAGSAVRLPLKP